MFRSEGMRKVLEIGGVISGVVLIAFGVVALVLSVDSRNTVRDSIRQEQVYFGSADDPAVAKHAEQWAGDQVTTGDQARAFALIMHDHALEASDGLTYAQMGRFVAADDPDNLMGTNDPEAALKDDSGNPVANSARNTWVTATALSTALNVSYMAEQLALFGVVVGIALILTGVGFIILALVALGSAASAAKTATRATTAPAAG
jgi:hypothetical protein